MKEKNGQEKFKAEVLKCGDSLAEFAGQAVVEDTISSHPAVKEFLTSGMSKEDATHTVRQLNPECHRRVLQTLRKAESSQIVAHSSNRSTHH